MTAELRDQVEQLRWLLDSAFEHSEHSLLTSVAAVRDKHWSVVPEGAGRSVGAILGHVGGAKYMYENFAFGDGSYENGQPPVVAPTGREAAIEWLREGHRRFTSSLVAVTDLRLAEERLTPWRGRLELRDIVRIVIEHDLHHAGEVNHLRALLDG
ncbi:MAG: DinB family protein, partial [Dehalococcoidia bacterium]|nr:DinB family protein [Dehalococcoidia bacterium]